MTDLRFDDPCLIFALARESKYLRRELKPNQRFPGAPCRARFCGPSWLSLLMLETGVGAAATAAALEWLAGPPKLDQVVYHPKLVISAGFCGALQGNLEVGAVILGTEAIDQDGKRLGLTWPGPIEGRWQPPLHQGPIYTAPHLVTHPEEKKALGLRHQALAVDMETARVAKWCLERGIPCGCVRTVSDDIQTALSPALTTLLSGGQVSPWRLAKALLGRPLLLGELLRLAKNSRHAARQLGLALGELLTLTLPANLR